jgi:hypothetical protein
MKEENAKPTQLSMFLEALKIVGAEDMDRNSMAYGAIAETIRERGLDWVKKNQGLLRAQVEYLKTM